MDAGRLPPEIQLGSVHLNTPNLDNMLRFYVETLGFSILDQQEGMTRLGTASGRELIVLHHTPDARREPVATGLYHFAVLLPTRLDLARLFGHLIKVGYPLQGAADHDVSEALYFADPDGNGIEFYRDRPRAEWEFRDGAVKMGTVALDFESLMDELQGLDDSAWHGLPADACMGHMHLQVHHIPTAEAFYRERLGFDLMLRYGGQASFLSAGGYHHHIGVNTWGTAGVPPPPVGSVGLRHYEILVPDQAALDSLQTRLSDLNGKVTIQPDCIEVNDPSGNRIRFSVSSTP